MFQERFKLHYDVIGEGENVKGIVHRRDTRSGVKDYANTLAKEVKSPVRVYIEDYATKIWRPFYHTKGEV